jgi:hypothetical protein
MSTQYVYMFFMDLRANRLFPYTALTDWFLGVFAKFRKATVSFAMSVGLSVLLLSAWINLASTRRILVKFDI